jgi:hypothetical protein
MTRAGRIRTASDLRAAAEEELAARETLVFTGPDVATLREVLALHLAETKWTTIYPDLTPEERAMFARRRAVCEKAMEAA